MSLRQSLLVSLFVIPVGILAACVPEDNVYNQTGKDAGSAESSVPEDGSVETRPDDANLIPCPPRLVLQSICQQCHSRPKTQNGAPFPLVYLSDIVAKRPNGKLIRELMVEQIEAGSMPYPPVTISASDKMTLLAWLQAGAYAIEPQQTCP